MKKTLSILLALCICLLPLCAGSIEIPQEGTKHSLNVSCAAAIVLWELWKSRPNGSNGHQNAEIEF